MFIPVDIGNQKALNDKDPTKWTAAHRTREMTKLKKCDDS